VCVVEFYVEKKLGSGMDYTKFVKTKCDWQSNVYGKDIEDCVAVYHIPESKQRETNQM